MALLQIIQHVCGRQNIPVPTTVYGTTDTQVNQLLKLLEEEGTDLSKRGDWQAITFQASHISTAADSQGNINDIATNGFRYIKNGTFWDRTDNLPILGPVTSEEWQQIQALTTTGPRLRYRLRGDRLLVTPTAIAGHTWAFEYMSKNWILGADGTTYKQYFTLDTDTVLLPEDLVVLGLRWRWKKEKGFDYAEDFETYEMQVKDDLGRDGGKTVLSMTGSRRDARPGFFVPDMSFNL